jgi:hypothetical protein
MVNVEIINLKLWSRNCILSLRSFHIHSCDLNVICDHWDHSWKMVINFLLVIHSWDFNIADNMSVSIGEGRVLGLITAECVDSINHEIRHGTDTPAATKNSLAAAQSHKLESALKIADGS